jgi:hypothetical protein
MKKTLILSSLFLLSMAEPVKLSKNIHIKVIDAEGITHHLRGISCNGRDYLKVREGSIEYSIPFESIKHIKVLSQKEGILDINVELTDGTERRISVSANTYCTSQSELGKASFYIKDVRDIFIEKGEQR